MGGRIDQRADHDCSRDEPMSTKHGRRFSLSSPAQASPQLLVDFNSWKERWQGSKYVRSIGFITRWTRPRIGDIERSD